MEYFVDFKGIVDIINDKLSEYYTIPHEIE